eukprot:12401042-Karenia_brevis.AAC.1
MQQTGQLTPMEANLLVDESVSDYDANRITSTQSTQQPHTLTQQLNWNLGSIGFAGALNKQSHT